MNIDVVGGAADATVYVGKPLIVSLSLRGDKYIAIEFPAKPKDRAARRVVIYMLCGMKPIDAVRIWRERFMEEPVAKPVKI